MPYFPKKELLYRLSAEVILWSILSLIIYYLRYLIHLIIYIDKNYVKKKERERHLPGC